jgi:CRISPR/Cas system CSM-associated protein Csm2 small subunit
MSTPVPAKENEDLLIQQIAALAIAGTTSILGVSKALNISRHQVRRFMADPRYREILDEVAEKELVPAITSMRNKIAKLGDKAIRVLEQHLDEGNLDAAKMVFKAMGLEAQEERQMDTTIQVIMPGAHDDAKTIEVEVDDV